MANIRLKAIEIISNDGTGLPLAYTNTTIGARSGKFFLITGRPGLTGAKTVAGDTTQTIWVEGILGPDGLTCSREIDIVDGGNTSRASSFNFSIINTAAFWNTLNSNSVYLHRCVVKFYIVTSSDDSTYTFTLRWTGVIDDQPFNETTYQVRCIDNYKSIFTQIPPLEVNSASFPEASPGSLGKTIPIALGRVAYSPMVNVVSSGEKTVLVEDEGIEYTLVAATQYDSGNRLLYLYTLGKLFLQDDIRLTGRYVSVVKGGSEQVRKIVGNDVTAGSTFITLIELSEGLDVTPAFKAWSPGETSTEVWYFEVNSIDSTLIASAKPISEFLLHPSGRKSLYSYDSTTHNYVDNSEITNISSPTSVGSTGFPGFKITSKSQDMKGDVSLFYPIYPTDVKLISVDGGTVSDSLVAGDSAVKLFDADQSTYYLLTSPGGGLSTYVFDVYFPKAEINKTVDDIHVLFDWEDRFASGTSPVANLFYASGKDFYQRVAGFLIDAFEFQSGAVDDSFNPHNYLPVKYYGEEFGDDATFYTVKDNYSISTLVDDVKSYQAYNVIRVAFVFFPTVGGTSYQFRLKELGFVAKRNVNVSTETQYTSLKGEKFGSNFGGRYEATDPALLLHEVAEYLPRVYDFNYPAWQASKAYTVATIIKTIADNGHLYIVTVAGTSHASTEPSFPTTAGDTVSDNTVTWKELKTIPIKTSAFDTLGALRAEWFIGRTLIEKKKSDEILKTLAVQGFFGFITTASGQLAPKSWFDNLSSSLTFDSSNIIQGTLGPIELTPMSRVSNDFLIHYDYNPGLGAFNRQISVTNIDRPAFPSQSDGALTYLGLTVTAITRVSVFGNHTFVLALSGVPALNVGDYCTLSGSTGGFDFSNRQVSSIVSTAVFVTGHITPTTTGSGGTFSKVNGQPTWKEYVTGISEYQTAKGIWDNCHASYVVCKSVNRLPPEIGDCHWFIDPAATDPAKVALWPELVVGDEHPAVFLARFLSNWITWQKKEIEFEVDCSTANMALELLDPATFNDAKLTGGVDKFGWVTSITDTADFRIKFKLILYPDQLAACNRILDTAGTANRILDTSGTANRVLDTAC